jgi:hypothetical protein
MLIGLDPHPPPSLIFFSPSHTHTVHTKETQLTAIRREAAHSIPSRLVPSWPVPIPPPGRDYVHTHGLDPSRHHHIIHSIILPASRRGSRWRSFACRSRRSAGGFNPEKNVFSLVPPPPPLLGRHI